MQVQENHIVRNFFCLDVLNCGFCLLICIHLNKDIRFNIFIIVLFIIFFIKRSSHYNVIFIVINNVVLLNSVNVDYLWPHLQLEIIMFRGGEVRLVQTAINNLFGMFEYLNLP